MILMNRARSVTGGVKMTDGIDYVKIFGDGFIPVDRTARIDLNEVIPCLPPVCPPIYDFTVIHEEAPVTEAAEASCTCHTL